MMKTFILATLLILMSCVESRNGSDIGNPQKPNDLKSSNEFNKKRTKIFKSQKPLKKYLNLTQRRDIDLSPILRKYIDAKTITIKSGKRGSLSFNVDEISGSSYINVIYANNYTILIEDNFGRKFYERMK